MFIIHSPCLIRSEYISRRFAIKICSISRQVQDILVTTLPVMVSMIERYLMLPHVTLNVLNIDTER